MIVNVTLYKLFVYTARLPVVELKSIYSELSDIEKLDRGHKFVLLDSEYSEPSANRMTFVV